MTDYFDHPGINASAIKAGRLSMCHMRHAIQADKIETAAMRWGRLVHSAVLDHKQFKDSVCVFDGYKRGKDWEAFKAANEIDWIVTAEELDRLDLMRLQLTVHLQAFQFVEDCETETPIYWTDKDYGEAKARLDGLGVGRIVEFKTTGSIAPGSFQRTAFRLGHHIQFGWYWHGAYLQTGKELQFYCICMEQKPPYDIVVYHVPVQILEQGRDEAIKIAKHYRICELGGVFPGVGREVMEFELPVWAGGDVELEIDGETVEL